MKLETSSSIYFVHGWVDRYSPHTPIDVSFPLNPTSPINSFTPSIENRTKPTLSILPPCRQSARKFPAVYSTDGTFQIFILGFLCNGGSVPLFLHGLM